MADLATLIARRDALEAAAAQGTQTVEVDGRRVTYRSTADLDLALARLSRQIDALQGGQRVRQIRLSTTKGL